MFIFQKYLREIFYEFWVINTFFVSGNLCNEILQNQNSLVFEIELILSMKLSKL